METTRRTTSSLTRVALLAALALILSYVESVIPLPVTIPGVKLGLANVAVLVALYNINAKTAFGLMLLKVLLSALLFGSPLVIVYSLAGGLLSFCLMLGLKRSNKPSIVVVSMVAAIAHNIAQVVVATWLLSTPALLFNLPFLVVVACVTGCVTGTAAAGVLRALRGVLSR
ncbi:MAG: Gx transporter family protein [Coriobacteriales bacterium]|jgi:heptaprenyl diphosphate synthase|nr:Gx transporter family protein [Coriobacteriales bacterium]